MLSIPGTLDVDYKERIIDYMVENDLQTGQDIDWKVLAGLPLFMGEIL